MDKVLLLPLVVPGIIIVFAFVQLYGESGMVTKTIQNLFGLSVVSYRFTELPERESRLLQLRECQKATVRWQEYLGSVQRISLNWNGKNLLMDVPSSAMGDRILYTGDEVCFHINEKNAVKIGDER